MAYVPGQNNDEDERLGEEGAAVQEPGAPVNISGGVGNTLSGTGGNTEAAATQQNAVSPNSGAGSGFTNLTKYLDQNKAQAGKLANKVGDTVKAQGDTARAAVDEAGTKFNQDVQQNEVNFNQGAFDALGDKGQNAQQVANTVESRDAINKQRNAQYEGPKSLETTDYYNPAVQEVQKAKEYAGYTSSDEGRKQLLQKIQQNRRASAGVTSLNNLLLQGGDAQNTLAQARDSASDLDARLSGVSEAAKARADQGAATTAATKQQAQSALEQVMAGFKGDLEGRVDPFLENVSTVDTFKAPLESRAGNTLTDQQLATLGVTRDQWNQLQGFQDTIRNSLTARTLNPASYNYQEWQKGMSLNPNNITAEQALNPLNKYLFADGNPALDINYQNLATEEDFARYQALQQLMGTSDSWLTDPAANGAVPTPKDDYVNFNYQAAHDDLSNKVRQLQRYEAELAAMNKRYGQALNQNHGFSAPVNIGDMQARIAEFLPDFLRAAAPKDPLAPV